MDKRPRIKGNKPTGEEIGVRESEGQLPGVENMYLTRGKSDSVVLAMQHLEKLKIKKKKKSRMSSRVLLKVRDKRKEGQENLEEEEEEDCEEEEDDDDHVVGGQRGSPRHECRYLSGALSTSFLGRASSESLHDHISISFFPPSSHDFAVAEAGRSWGSRSESEFHTNYDSDADHPCISQRISADRKVDDGRLKSRPPPKSLQFVDVTHHIHPKKKTGAFTGWFSKLERPTKVVVLRGVTGHVTAGEMAALMGPSGSGKTTLLNLLSGRVARVGGSNISYNGMPLSKSLKRRMGFVAQDDVLYPHLTVKETLTYAALLRLPNHLTKKQKVDRAREVISELGLERCQDTIIGGAFLRGISGGERKRVCVGHEILIDPSILFLDEPTSGLDSTTALRMVNMLHNISKSGRTVILTIHQPSSRLFYMFDKLMLLSEGHMIYFGKPSLAKGYFASIGFSPLITMNPSDFLLDLANGIVTDIVIPSHLIPQYDECKAIKDANVSNFKPSTQEIRKYLCASFQRLLEPMEKQKLYDLEIDPIKSCGNISERMESMSIWWSQFVVLFVRGQKQRRHEYLSSLKIFQHMLSSFIIGILWFNSNINTEKDIINQVALLFFISAYWSLSPLSIAIQCFPPERAILAKERASHMYHLSAYFMARIFGDLPLQLCLPTFSILIIYFMTHLRKTVESFFLTLLAIWLTVITAQSLGIAIGAIVMDLKKAMTLGTTIILISMLAGGFLIQHMPNFISWVKYVVFNYYTFHILLKIQYEPNQLYDCTIASQACHNITQILVAHNFSLDFGTQSIAIVLCMAMCYNLMAFFALRSMKLNV